MGRFLGKVRFASAGSSGRYIGDVEISGPIPLPGGTPGGVVFVDASGNLTDDPTVFFWDDTSNRLGIGNNAPATPLDVTGLITSSVGLISPKAGPTSARQHTIPNVVSDTFALLDAQQTLTQKTLTAPVIATLGPSTLQQHTVPAVASDTFALLAANQVFTNKTLTSPTIQGTVAAGSGLTMPAFTQSGNIAGNFSFTGNITLGDASTDEVVFTSVINSNLTFKFAAARTIAPNINPTVGGSGTVLTLNSGQGAASNGVTPGAAGGTFLIQAGSGGNGAAGLAAGNGADLQLRGGSAGPVNGGTGGNGGSVSIDAGQESGAGVVGNINIGATRGTIQIGRAGATATVIGNFTVNANTTIGLSNTTVAFGADISNASLGFTSGIAHLIEVRQPTTPGTVGSAMSVSAAKGANGSGATPGALGGIYQVFGGFGGDGTAAAAAGAGEAVRIKGGTAGLNNGGGGNNGGDVLLEGGTATGAGVAGLVKIGVTGTSKVVFGVLGLITQQDGTIDLQSQGGDPATPPAAGYVRLFAKSDGANIRLYTQTAAGAINGPY